YLIPLVDELALPRTLAGKTNSKSTTGRLDVFTRTITDFHARFDEIRAGYRGKLYLEVVPRSFSVRVAAGMCLNQLRLFSGSPSVSDAGRRGGNRRLRSRRRRAARALRRLLRSRLRIRRRGTARHAHRPGGTAARRAVPDPRRPDLLQGALRADAGAARKGVW